MRDRKYWPAHPVMMSVQPTTKSNASDCSNVMVNHLFQEGREALIAIRGRAHHEGHQVHGVASKMWEHS